MEGSNIQGKNATMCKRNKGTNKNMNIAFKVMCIGLL